MKKDINPDSWEWNTEAAYEEVQEMDKVDKLHIYMDYYITQLGMSKIPFIGYTYTTKEKQNGFTEEIKTPYFKFIDGICAPMSFEKFINDKINIIEVDQTSQYHIEHNFAIGKWKEYRGIYDWYWKFKERIKLNKTRL